MSAAIISILAQISLPMPGGVPLTLQTFAVILCGFLFGRARAVTAVGIYLLLGACGLPVFASFRGGFGILFGVTGGFLWGFLLLAACAQQWKPHHQLLGALSGVAGLLCCHAVGIIWYCFLVNSPPVAAFLIVSAPFLPKDIIMVLLAWWLAGKIHRRLEI